jgi:alpha-beta hydrolase superfamily lysophospholipase
MEELQNKPLAFSTGESLITATSRIAHETKDNSALLNIELFENETNDDSPILLLLHGVCASAETKSVQSIVTAAKQSSVKVATLELEGHGLSSGKRMVCGDFERHLGHVLEFVQAAIMALRKGDEHSSSVPYYFAANSLGGVLAIYAAEHISNNRDKYPSAFGGVAAIAPAVGVDERKIPSAPITFGLSLLATIAPAMQLSLTPHEDPSSYSCPPNSSRNFSGHWPLATSKMLLDVTTFKVKNDLENGAISLSSTDRVLIFAGKTDETVPFDVLTGFYDTISPKQKHLIPVGGGHDMMTFKSSSDEVTKALFEWVLLGDVGTGKQQDKD